MQNTAKWRGCGVDLRKKRADWSVKGPAVKKYLSAGLTLAEACAEAGVEAKDFHAWMHRGRRHTLKTNNQQEIKT